MARAIDSPTIDDRDLTLRWSGRVSLTPRILAVNIFALALLAGGFFYLDTYRARIIDSRVAQSQREARLMAEALDSVAPDQRDQALTRLARSTETRLRLYDRKGKLLLDSRNLGLRNFRLRDPDKDPWQLDVARFLDAMIDTVVGAERAPLYRERGPDLGFQWPDVRTARMTDTAAATVWRAPDRTVVITAAAPLADGETVMSTVNALDITQTVRLERYRLSVVLALVALVSILLSLFLARTIVLPLQRLARAAGVSDPDRRGRPEQSEQGLVQFQSQWAVRCIEHAILLAPVGTLRLWRTSVCRVSPTS